MKKLTCLSVLLFSSVFTGVSQADVSQDATCGKLGIMIQNATGAPCTLLSANLKHGYLTYSTSIPTFIPPGSIAGPLILQQSVYGPEIELSYSCDSNKVVTFNSRQNFCAFSAGEVYGEQIYAQNASLTYQTVIGSWLWSQRGNITWQIE